MVGSENDYEDGKKGNKDALRRWLRVRGGELGTWLECSLSMKRILYVRRMPPPGVEPLMI